MKIIIEFEPPKCCMYCRYKKYINHSIKHFCLIFKKKIPNYRDGERLEECIDYEKHNPN